MSSRRPEVADVLRTFSAAYRENHPVSADQQRVLFELPLCRTASLGGHKLRCDSCGHEQISYNSCRNRHCPKCQAAARAQWLAAREAELLNVPYFHVVFTIPDELAAIALQNKRLCYGLIFRAAAQTLRTIAADPKHLGAEIGFLAVLHTWTQTLLHHPHVHCVVPGGGISPNQGQWISCRDNFFLSVRVLSRLFRRLYLEGIQKAHGDGATELHGRLEGLREPTAWARMIAQLRRKEWVVYAKPPFGGPTQVLKYLARYTHRVAISNQRLVAVDDQGVTFRWKDRSATPTAKTMKLAGPEFVRRFLLHILPKGFVRIRHFGFLANRVRADKIDLARRLLAQQRPDPPISDVSIEVQPPIPPNHCPRCSTGRLVIVEELPPGHPALLDTS